MVDLSSSSEEPGVAPQKPRGRGVKSWVKSFFNTKQQLDQQDVEEEYEDAEDGDELALVPTEGFLQRVSHLSAGQEEVTHEELDKGHSDDEQGSGDVVVAGQSSGGWTSTEVVPTSQPGFTHQGETPSTTSAPSFVEVLVKVYNKIRHPFLRAPPKPGEQGKLEFVLVLINIVVRWLRFHPRIRAVVIVVLSAFLAEQWYHRRTPQVSL